MTETAVTLDPGLGGDDVAIDKIAGKDYQRIKLTDGTTDGTTGIASGGGVEAAALRVTIANDSTGLVSVDDNGSSLSVDDGGGSITVDGTVTANAGTGPWPVTDNGGSLTVDGTVAVSGTVAVTDNSGSLTVDAPVGTPVFATITPSTAGGWTPKIFTALTNTKTLINNAACTFGGYLPLWNPNASVAYIQVFDVAATASVTLGTTAPNAILPIPPGSAANVEVGNGVHMTNGIVIAITTTATGSTAPGTGLDGTLLYK